MQGKSKVAAIIIIASVMCALGLYVWAGAKQAGLYGYGFMRLYQGDLVVNFDRSLVWLDETGRERRALDLQIEGLRPVGDFDFFANGDVLVYHRAAPLGVWQNIKAFLRLREPSRLGSAVQAGARADGFYRCRLAPLDCQPLLNPQVLPARSLRLAVDREQNVIYLADTADHSVYKLSASGEVLAARREGFKFPNQLIIREGSLWLADTNHHRLVELNTATDKFATEVNSYRVTLGGEHRWPHQLTPTRDGFWVLVGNNAMANGRLALVTGEGEVSQPLAANVLSGAGLTDPLAIQLWQGDLWLSDFAEPKLVRINVQSQRAHRVESESLAALEQRYLARYSHYQLWKNTAIALFVLVLVGGFIAAWLLEKEQTRAAIRSAGRAKTFSVDGEVTPTGSDEIVWLPSALKPWHHWLPKIIWVIWGFMLLALALLYFGAEETPAAIMQLGVIMVVFLAVVSWGVQRLFGFLSASRLGVIGESLVLVDGKGARTVARGAELAYSQHFIFADQIALALGNPNMRFFNEAELKKWVYPRLKQGHKLSPWEQTKHLWRLRHPQMIYSAVMLLAVLILYLLIEFVLVKP
ncbi:hypothetical protein [Gilvimarinus sp. DA14]|uniref:hypothetical protein n=1 Tax=Gilvimarinus sp. DA14 TaxID=2956798 RepID=UPI0020B8BADD|nr:hypothetical protein [Gilvimarinus sp. DA14]UTF59544.1 hypothetical protein NHM04_13835 [Gilvimarinus sp. DA14]